MKGTLYDSSHTFDCVREIGNYNWYYKINPTRMFDYPDFISFNNEGPRNKNVYLVSAE